MLKLHPWNLKLCHFQRRNHLSTPMSIYLRWKGDNFLGGRTVFLLDGGSFLDETSMTQQTWLSEETWAVSKSSWWIPWLRWLWILPNASNVSIIHEVWLEWRNSTFIPKNETLEQWNSVMAHNIGWCRATKWPTKKWNRSNFLPNSLSTHFPPSLSLNLSSKRYWRRRGRCRTTPQRSETNPASRWTRDLCKLLGESRKGSQRGPAKMAMFWIGHFTRLVCPFC